MKLSSRPLNPLYDKKIVCLCCEKEFTSKQVRSSSTRVIKQDRDYCTYYSGENPLFMMPLFVHIVALLLPNLSAT